MVDSCEGSDGCATVPVPAQAPEQVDVPASASADTGSDEDSVALIEEAGGERIASSDFLSTECVVNGWNRRVESESDISDRVPASKFGSTEAVIEDARPKLSQQTVHETIAKIWHEALAPLPTTSKSKEDAEKFKPLPLPASRSFKHGTSGHIQLVRHRSPFSKIEAITIFLPGCHGGLGPCRANLPSDGSAALFPLLAQELSQNYPMDCYRVSWSESWPSMEETVHAVCRAVLYALSFAPVALDPAKKTRILIVGHSFGAGAALHTARKLCDMVATLQAEVGGVVTLASQWAGDALLGLNAPKLFIHGKDDEELTCQVSLALYALSSEPRELRLVPNCDHNFSSHKQHLLKVLGDWLVVHGRCGVPGRLRDVREWQ